MIAEQQFHPGKDRTVRGHATDSGGFWIETKVGKYHPGRSRAQIVVARLATGSIREQIAERFANHFLRAPRISSPVLDPRITEAGFVSDEKIGLVQPIERAILAEIAI